MRRSLARPAAGSPRVVTWLAVLILTAAAFPPGRSHATPRPDPPQRVSAFSFDRTIDANQISMFVTNWGHLAWDLRTGSPGLEYPGGTGKTAVFASGLWLGVADSVGVDSGGVRVVVAEYTSEYLPGAAPGGLREDPLLADLRVFKLSRVYADPDSQAVALAEYTSGAVPRGAPPVHVLPDGSLDILGDQMLWAVYNDLEPAAHFARPGGTAPLGVEVQQTVYAFDRPGALGRSVFLSFKVINHSNLPLHRLYLALWSDPDLGGATDDLAGCDPGRSLGYCYNATNSDLIYGSTPPAVGFDLLRVRDLTTGQELPATAFIKYINGTDPSLSSETYSYMQGLMADGSPINDPTTGLVTTFMHLGDPVTGTGWLDASPSDRRMFLSSGPYELFAEGILQLDAAIVIGQGGDRLSSISALRSDDDEVQAAFDAGFGPACDAVAMGFDFTPTTLNLRSMGRWVNGYLEPPSTHSPSQIDVTSIRLNDAVSVDPTAPTSVGDHDANGRPDLMVKFDRSQVQAVLPEGAAVPVRVTGQIGDDCFEGSTLARTIHPRVTAPDTGDVVTPGLIAPIRWETPAAAAPRWVALLSSMDDGQSWELVNKYLPNYGSASWQVPYSESDRARVAVVLVEQSDESGDNVEGIVGTSPRFRVATTTGVGPAYSDLALLGSVPSPARGPLRVAFRIPDASEVFLSLHDVAGRRLWTGEVRGLEAGTHTVPVAEGMRLPPGVYLMRLRQAGEERTARIAVIE